MAEIDYRAICLELFGTDDVEKLKMIAKQIRQKKIHATQGASASSMKRKPRR